MGPEYPSIVPLLSRSANTRDPVESCKLRYFNPFEFFDHTRWKSQGRHLSRV